MNGRNLRVALAMLAIGITCLVVPGSSSAATKTTTYPTVCSSMLCTFPLPTVWNQSVSYESATCAQLNQSCPSITGGRAAYQGRFVPGVFLSGTATVAAAASHTWTTPTGVQFVYNGAAGSKPDSLTFTIDRAALVQALIDLGGSATMSVFLDDLDAGASLTVVSQRPIANQDTFTTDPTVSVDPSRLTIGHRYAARVVTRFTFPVGTIPSTSIYYRNFFLTATAEDTDGDDVVDNSDNCPAVSNADQLDTDDDGQGDVCDSTPNGDNDEDGVDNAADNCPNASNAGQADADGDGTGDACDSTPNGDTDEDGVDNAADNCPNASNPDQADTDVDGQGDACDATPNGDTDEDVVDNGSDNCPGTSNADQADLDSDGLGDVCDVDIDGDGVPNGSDPNPRGPNPPPEDQKPPAATGREVRVKVKCPSDASALRCKVRVVGRAGEKGPRVTNVVRTAIGRGEQKLITLTIEQPFLEQVQAAGRVIVVRSVRKGPQKPKQRVLSRPLIDT